MRREALNQAIEGVSTGAADSPLSNLMKLAAEVADCPYASLMVIHPGRDQVVAGWGVPSSFFRQHIPNTPEDIEFRKIYRQVDDIRTVPALENSLALQEMGIHFMVVVPLPIERLDVGIHIVCGDFRENVQRAPDLRKRLEDIALICAGVLRQSGEIVEQAERLSKVRSQIDHFVEVVTSADRHVAFLDSKFRVVKGTQALERDMAMQFNRNNRIRLSELFSDDVEKIEEQVAIIREEDIPFRIVSVNYRPDNSKRIIIIMRINGADIDQPKYCVDIRLRNDRSSLVPEPIAHNILNDSGISNYMHENPATLTNFLFSTLIENRKVHHRKGIAYHSIRRWKGPIKDVQIETLKALKKDPSEQLITRVAGEIVQEAVTLFGADAFEAVAFVPCGHSGPGCFACKLAQAVAALMDKPYYEAFEPLPVKGTSHPNTSARRPKMVLREIERKSTLLIDDVATSGSHIGEAAKALREAGVTVFPISWIGG